MGKISIPPARKYLQKLFRNAAKIDIEVGDFTFAGWREIYSVIPRKAQIRLIIGQLDEKTDLMDPASVADAIAKKAFLSAAKSTRLALEDVASRIQNGSMQVRGHYMIHGKMYSCKKRFRSLRIIAGSGNLSKRVLDPEDENYQGNIWLDVRLGKSRRSLQNHFEQDWEECGDASKQLLQLILKILNLPADWEPPKLSFFKRLFRKREM